MSSYNKNKYVIKHLLQHLFQALNTTVVCASNILVETHLTIFATLSLVDLDTFFPLMQTMRSPFCKPAAAAGEPASTRPTLTGQPPITEKP